MNNIGKVKISMSNKIKEIKKTFDYDLNTTFKVLRRDMFGKERQEIDF